MFCLLSPLLCRSFYTKSQTSFLFLNAVRCCICSVQRVHYGLDVSKKSKDTWSFRSLDQKELSCVQYFNHEKSVGHAVLCLIIWWFRCWLDHTALLSNVGSLIIYFRILLYWHFTLSVDCKKELRRYIDGLFQIYERAVSGEGTFKVSAEDSLHLVEALRYFWFFEAHTPIKEECKLIPSLSL